MARDKSIIKKHAKIADKIINLDAEMTKLSEDELKNKTLEFRQRLEKGETLDDILIEAYAVVREASFRALGLKAFRVQIIGSIILHQGDIAEMKTGEGKTLTGIFPAYLNALSGIGVHIVTVNEYLSKRDSELNGLVYSLLGITVGLNGRDLSKDQKRYAYAQDVTYTTNAELGFDYLRDNMVFAFEQKVQRKLNYAIIDEADSILIDEARTPLIISGGTQNRINFYKAADTFAKSLKDVDDVGSDLETKQVFLTDPGIIKAQEYFSIKNLFDVQSTEVFHLIMNALRANFVFKEGIEYTVKDGEIVLIDQFTGRVMPGRSYSDGLHQALQAKEDVEIEEETQTLATITYQNFYRLYNKLSGMTGTAKTEEEEFIKIYNTRVIVCPTNRPIIRKDISDLTFASKHSKLKKVMEDLKEINESGRPVLIGTTSVESSEQVARYLEKANLKFEMINAKNHHRESEIVEKAGQIGAITLATNMAGRGTDIKLTEETKKLGGLFVLGIERNEARRIDNQLRGRSGRQGDPGTSRFYISMEDELMLRFTAPKLRERFLKYLGDDHLESRLFTRAITNAQKKLEGLNFDQRKNVLDYDNVLSQHREAMYAQRDDILVQPDLKVVMDKFQYTLAFELVLKHSEVIRGEYSLNTDKLIEDIHGRLIADNVFDKKSFIGKERTESAELIQSEMMKYYLFKIKDIPENVASNMERRIILQGFDKFWTRHINISQKLRTGIYLQQYAQNNPLHQYIEESSILFNKMKIDIATESIENIFNTVQKQVSNEDLKTQTVREPVRITDKDIDAILADWGMSKQDFSRKNVEKKLEELKTEFKDNEENLRKVDIQFNILNGLMNELDKMFAQQQTMEANLTREQLDALVEKFDVKNRFFEEAEIIKKLEELTKLEEGPQLAIEAQILIALSRKMKEDMKKGELVFPGAEEKKKPKKRTKSKKDDDQQPDLFDDEKVQTEYKTKIG